MVDQNYFEIVAVPVLQRKCQELFNSNMILETNLHMEVTKARHAAEELARVKTELTSSTASSTTELQSLQKAFNNAQSHIQSLDAEIVQLRNQFGSSQRELHECRTANQQLQTALDSALQQVSSLQAASAALVVPVEEPKATSSRPSKAAKSKVVEQSVDTY